MTKAILRKENLDAVGNISELKIWGLNGLLPNNFTVFKDVSFPKYASFEAFGIDLKNEKLTLASQYSNLPIYSDRVCTYSYIDDEDDNKEKWYWGGEMPISIRIKFSQPQDLSDGIQLRFRSDVFYYRLYVSLMYKNQGDEFYQSRDARLYNNKDGIVNIDTTGIEPQSSINFDIWPWVDTGYSFCTLESIIFGREIEFDDIIGQANCFSEVKPTLDDAPAGSCDLTVVSSTIPEEGQTIRIESDNFKGKYTIEEVTRQAEDIFSIKGYDDIQELDATAFEDDTAITSAEQITSGTAVAWIDTPTASVSGTVKENTTRRQALAMYSIASGKAMTSFNETDGIFSLTLGNNTVYDILSDEILGKAEYKAQPSYSAVVLKYKNADGEEESTSVELTTKGNRTKGNYEITKTTLFGSSKTTMLNNIRHYINGAEVEATIIYNGQKLGDKVRIETPFNGFVTGIIKSIDLALGSRSSTAHIVVKEVG